MNLSELIKLSKVEWMESGQRESFLDYLQNTHGQKQILEMALTSGVAATLESFRPQANSKIITTQDGSLGFVLEFENEMLVEAQEQLRSCAQFLRDLCDGINSKAQPAKNRNTESINGKVYVAGNSTEQDHGPDGETFPRIGVAVSMEDLKAIKGPLFTNCRIIWDRGPVSPKTEP